MTKRFYIDVTFTGFNGKLSIDIDAGSEKQAWEVVDTMLSGRLYQLKTTRTIDRPVIIGRNDGCDECEDLGYVCDECVDEWLGDDDDGDEHE